LKAAESAAESLRISVSKASICSVSTDSSTFLLWTLLVRESIASLSSAMAACRDFTEFLHQYSNFP